MIVIEYNQRCDKTIKLTNDITFKEVTVMFDTVEQKNQMVLNLLDKICNGEDQ